MHMKDDFGIVRRFGHLASNVCFFAKSTCSPVDPPAVLGSHRHVV